MLIHFIQLVCGEFVRDRALVVQVCKEVLLD
jgi:hypothetical protein